MGDNGLIAISCALFIGYSIGRWRQSSSKSRCSSTVPTESSDGIHRLLRCSLRTEHTGPHGAFWHLERVWWWGSSEPQDTSNAPPTGRENAE